MSDPCTESERIVRMEEQLKSNGREISEVKSLQKEMANDLKTFYQTANSTYATKEELEKEITRLEVSRNWIADNWDKIIYMFALAVIGLLYLKDKI